MSNREEIPLVIKRAPGCQNALARNKPGTAKIRGVTVVDVRRGGEQRVAGGMLEGLQIHQNLTHTKQYEIVFAYDSTLLYGENQYLDRL